jgi:hypothetical protein
MGSESWEVGEITGPTVAAAGLFAYMVLVWAATGVTQCTSKRRRR